MKIQEAVLQLKEDLEEYHWVLDVVSGQDSGGPLIEIRVNSDLYPKSDPLLRSYYGFSACVVKLPKKKVVKLS